MKPGSWSVTTSTAHAIRVISTRPGNGAPPSTVAGRERASARVASPRIPHHARTTASRTVRGAADGSGLLRTTRYAPSIHSTRTPTTTAHTIAA